jgi:hypothetical protein
MPYILRILILIRSFFLEKLPAYLLLLVTRRWISISLVGAEETINEYETLTFQVIVNAPSLREKKKALRMGLKDNPGVIPVIGLIYALEEIRARKFPRTAVIMNIRGERFALIVPKKNLDLDQ